MATHSLCNGEVLASSFRGSGLFPRITSIESEPVLGILRAGFRFQAAIEGIAIGLLIGLIDIHSTSGGWFNALVAFLAVGFALGVRHASRAWQAWLPLSSSLYVMHLAAISCGYRPPYVEADAERAGACVVMALPAALALGLGALVRFCISVKAQSVVTDSGVAKSNRPESAVPDARTIRIAGELLRDRRPRCPTRDLLHGSLYGGQR